MTLSCGEVRDRFDAYGSEALTAVERRAVREHLRSCDPCREEASAVDPLFQFAGAVAAPVPADVTAGVLAAVRTGIAFKTAERRLGVPTARRRAGALACAAAAVVLTLLVPGAPPRRASMEALATKGGPAARSFVPASNPAPAGKILPKAGGTKTYPADATIYDLSSGAGEPRVVWIVDRSLDI
jgi:predicted anti-sigma-YlaC factor YlaD